MCFIGIAVVFHAACLLPFFVVFPSLELRCLPFAYVRCIYVLLRVGIVVDNEDYILSHTRNNHVTYCTGCPRVNDTI